MRGHSTPEGSAVHIWRVDLTLQEDQLKDCRRLLSADENERADRFYSDRDRRRFIAARRAMRAILSEYLSVLPQEVAYSYAANGKPELAPCLRESGIKFNLSHSKELALIAVAQGLCLGVDIEFIDPELEIDEISSAFFSQREISTLRALPSARRRQAFFKCWTRKEAYIKALGKGLSLPLDRFDVAFGTGASAVLLQAEVFAEELSRWSMYDISISERYPAALVVEGKKHRLQQKQWASHS
jgi:4'-phosphopantetheinyl transferase